MGHEGPEMEMRYSSTLSLTSALEAGGRSTPCAGRFTPYPFMAGWTPGPIWMGVENLTLSWTWFLDWSARCESLYWL